jgi:hypothetical protein
MTNPMNSLPEEQRLSLLITITKTLDHVVV